ncbi:MAG: nitrogenase iron-molybdenum cofactor biosynthesis protein NifE [Clostridia bacterium]|nr:nitrogenase iron-molybdenum cofactor biosynthesis protein NifE [Clostridia bacterium]
MDTARDLVIEERKDSISTKGKHKKQLKCDTDSVAGCVSQRACVYCGARVVLNPITDAIHLVHGPIGCASYTWDIRGSLSSGSDLYRNSFSTDLKEEDVIFGGEKKLAKAIDELVANYPSKLVFVYSTCIVGVIGDDLEAVCKAASQRHNIEVIPVQSSGFIGNKSAGYRAACDALLRLIEPQEQKIKKTNSINYLGDFNLAAEAWIIQNYLKEMGIDINVTFTGDSSYDALKKAPGASLNIIQCAGSMTYLAGKMKEIYNIPYLNISFLGIEDTSESLRKVAAFFNNKEMMARTEALIERQTQKVLPVIEAYREKFAGKKAAVYVGGGFKAISLIKQFREIGIEVVMIGTQTGQKDEYETIHELVDEGTVVLDDANPAELEKFMVEKGAHLLVGGVKERPLAYKLGVAFIDHNHDRKHPLGGYVGAVNFAKEVYSTLCSPVWKYVDSMGGV